MSSEPTARRPLRVALLVGGASAEREVSLESGAQVAAALDPSRYQVTRYDPRTDLPQLHADRQHIDVAFLALHGKFGEDGTIQGFLELLGIPYQGAGVLGSALAMDKWMSKRLYDCAGLPVPRAELVAGPTDLAEADRLGERLGFPLVVKPRRGGSSIGTRVVAAPDGLAEALAAARAEDPDVLLEQFIDGVEITGAVLGNRRPQSLPLVEVLPGGTSTFFDYRAKYTAGVTEEICPARLPEAIARRARELAVRAHEALCLRGFSRTDMMVAGEDVYLLETNTIPGMTPLSLYPLAAQTAGMSFPELLDRLIELALE